MKDHLKCKEIRWICLLMACFACQTNIAGCTMVENADSQKIEGKTESGDEPLIPSYVLPENPKLAKEWKEWWFDSCKNERELEMMKAALEEASKYARQGEVLSPGIAPGTPLAGESIIVAEPGFPDSGIGVLFCVMSGGPSKDPYFSSMYHPWLAMIVQEDGSYTVTSECPRLLFVNCLKEEGVEARTDYHSLWVNNAWCSRDVELREMVEGWNESIFINYKDYAGISDFFQVFQTVCENMKAYEEELGISLSQKIRFGECDEETDMEYNKRFYTEYLINFTELADNPALLEELEEQVRAEQLDYFKKMQPERYEAIKNGSYLSRKDYRSAYYVPFCRAYAPWGRKWDGAIGGFGEERLENGSDYKGYLADLAVNDGRPKGSISEEWPEYKFFSVDSQYSNRRPQKAVYHDYFRICFPPEYSYGAGDRYEDIRYGDVIFYDYGLDKPFSGFSKDMEIQENRQWDRGRLYLMAVEGEGLSETEQRAKIEKKMGQILREPVKWTIGEYETPFQDFWYATGETSLRSAAVYFPRMREEENFQWVLLFEVFKDSETESNIYEKREEIIQSFVPFPYWYECKQGDTLEGISRRYTGSPFGVYEITDDPLNEIIDPNRIEVGQKIHLSPAFWGYYQ